MFLLGTRRPMAGQNPIWHKTQVFLKALTGLTLRDSREGVAQPLAL